MNFYRRYIGDFQRDTRRLTLLEKGAYNELLDLFYASEEPLPLDHRELYRACGCEVLADRRAIDRMLLDFFEKTENGYVQKRAMVEIERASDRRVINRRNGQNGGRPIKTELVSENKTELVSEQKAIQEPVTINHEKDLDQDQNTLVSDKSPPCPHLEIIALYNRILPELPAVIPNLWDGTRKKHLQTRWRESPIHQSLAFWERFFNALRRHEFYLGQNDRGWKPNLEWLITKSHFVSLIEKFTATNKKTTGAITT